MYSIRDYGAMVSDQLRTRAYAEALERSVGPDSVVLDIGTGTGILSFLACRYGARRVFAMEPTDSIEVAKEAARANGFADRIEFIKAFSTEVDLPERADVIVGDLHGILPFFQQSIPTLIDARNRHLVAGGVIIPSVETIRAAPVMAPAQHASLTSDWQRCAYGFDFGAASRLILSSFHRAKCTARDLVAPVATLGTLEYATACDANFTGSARFTAECDGVAHGWVIWFDALFCPNVEISNAPGMPPLIYGQAFFPWPEPVALRIGDQLQLRVRAHLVGDNYLWAWDSDLPGHTFRQSELDAEILSPDSLRRHAAGHVPSLGVEARVDRRALELMDAGLALGEIATALAGDFPERFPRWEAALTHAAQLAKRYDG